MILMQKAFTLIEVLIIVAILGILAIITLSAINPLENIRKGYDVGVIQAMESITNAINGYSVFHSKQPWDADIETTIILDEPALSVLTSLESSNELRKGFQRSRTTSLSQINFTATSQQQRFALCFSPQSNAFKQHENTVFTISGEFDPSCFENSNECYYCFGEYTTDALVESIETHGKEDEDTQSSEEILCADFNPEQPNFPWTCNNSTTWQEYGCSRYCVSDKGCDGFCPPGQRHLVKSYSGTGAGFMSCLSHSSETAQDYCVPDPYAQCEAMSYGSSPSDFTWGCSDPRRPYEWVQ